MRKEVETLRNFKAIHELVVAFNLVTFSSSLENILCRKSPKIKFLYSQVSYSITSSDRKCIISIRHFLLIFVELKLICLVTLFDRIVQFYPKLNKLIIFDCVEVCFFANIALKTNIEKAREI